MNIRLSYALFVLLASAITAPFSLAQSGLDDDFDGDGITNREDNCYIFANPQQLDADSDGYGNICDADFNNDGMVDFLDFDIFSQQIFTTNQLVDLNSDGNVNFLDLSIFKTRFNSAPGPTILLTWIGGSGSWGQASNWRPAEVPSLLHQYAVVNTSHDEIVTVEESTYAGAKGLELNGNLVACGILFVSTTVEMKGTITIDCGGRLDSPMGVNVDGLIHIESGRLRSPFLAKVEDSNSELIVSQNAEFDGTLANNHRLTTDVDIRILPGARLLQFGELMLENASIKLISEESFPATLELPNTLVSGTGSIEFYGPSNDTAVGTILSFGAVVFDQDIEVFVEPDAYAFFDSQITNYGNIVISDSATLLFDNFNLVTNSGTIHCSNDGHLLESGSGQAGDSVLINNADGKVIVEDCTTSWPTRVINNGQYEITSSQITMPLIGSTEVPLNITNSDISIREFQPPIPAELYVFAPANENSVLVNGLFDLGQTTLTIDAAKWRFSEDQPARFEFGTLVSDTPLNINSDARVTFRFVDLNTEVTLDPASELILAHSSKLMRNLSFLEPDSCDGTPLDPAVLRLDHTNYLFPGSIEISAVSSIQSGCLNAEIVTDVNSTLPALADIQVSNATMKIYSEAGGSVELEGATAVAGTGAELILEQVVNSGTLSCSDGASLSASGTALQPFVNDLLVSTTDCDITLSDYWQNNGDVFTNSGSLNLSGTDGVAFDPGSGTFFADGTNILFDMEISDPSQLEVFKIVPPSGTFSFAGNLTATGPVFDTSAFPFNTQFTNGFELTDTRVVGIQPFRLADSATLRNLELATDTVVLGGTTVNVFDQLTLDESVLFIQSNSIDVTTATSSVVLDGVSSVAGSGAIVFEALGTDARSELVQAVDSVSLEIATEIDLQCYGFGQCFISAGVASGTLDVFGYVLAADPSTRLVLGSDTTFHRAVTAFDRAQIHISDNNLTFSGPDAGLELELVTDMTDQPSVVASGSASIDVSTASLFFFALSDYEPGSGAEVVVLGHEGDALRIGEFADISGAQFDGQPFLPDYSSPDVTIFRGPLLDTQQLSSSKGRL